MGAPRRFLPFVAVALLFVGAAPAVLAQQVPPDDPAEIDTLEPDFVVVNLPTTLRLPRYKGNFRIAHRFNGDLLEGSFGHQASTLFGIDEGATIGFEYRIGVAENLQAAVFRTSFGQTIQLYGKYDALRQGPSLPVSVSGIASVEGTENFQHHHAPAAGAVVSRRVAGRAVLYASPIWVGNSAATPTTEPDADESGQAATRQSTMMLGLGTRVRLTSSVYVAGEVSPRLAGYAPGDVEYGFGLEKRIGGHIFSITFTNTAAMTFAQVARGGSVDSLFLGFNLARKFF